MLAGMFTSSNIQRIRLGNRRRTGNQKRATVPAGANPLAKLVFHELGEQDVTYDELESASGILRCSIKAWRNQNSPGLLSIEATLGALGWALVPVPQLERLPDDIAEGLAELNKQWAGKEPLLHHLLAQACLAPVSAGGFQRDDTGAPVRLAVAGLVRGMMQ